MAKNNQPTNSMCGSCPNAHQCREVWSEPNRGPFSPAGLSLGSALVFLLPIITAIIAGALTKSLITTDTKFPVIIATAAGLALGGFLAWLILPLIKNRFPAQPPNCDYSP